MYLSDREKEIRKALLRDRQINRDKQYSSLRQAGQLDITKKSKNVLNLTILNSF